MILSFYTWSKALKTYYLRVFNPEDCSLCWFNLKALTALLILVLLNSACHSPVKQGTANKRDSLINRQTSENSEYLDWDSVKLNGIIPMISRYGDVVNKLGKPDSIVRSDDNESAPTLINFKYCYFKGTQFEKHSDTLVWRSIDFRKQSNNYLWTNKIKLSHITTIKDFEKVFPISVENNGLPGTAMDKNQWISVPAFSNLSEGAWILHFDRDSGNLLDIEYDSMAKNHTL